MKVIEINSEATNFCGIHMGTTRSVVLVMSDKELQKLREGLALLLETYTYVKREPKWSSITLLKSDMHVDQTWETLKAFRKFYAATKRPLRENYGRVNIPVPPIDWKRYLKKLNSEGVSAAAPEN